MGTYSEEIQVNAGKALSDLLQENVNIVTLLISLDLITCIL